MSGYDQDPAFWGNGMISKFVLVFAALTLVAATFTPLVWQPWAGLMANVAVLVALSVIWVDQSFAKLRFNFLAEQNRKLHQLVEELRGQDF